MLVLEAGKVAECGPVADVLAAPRSRFGARIAGVNLLRGVLTAPGALRSAEACGMASRLRRCPQGQRSLAVFSPAAVAVYRNTRTAAHATHPRPDRRIWTSPAPAVRVRGTDHADGGPGLAADVTRDAVAELGLQSGSRCGSPSRPSRSACTRALGNVTVVTRWSDTADDELASRR